MLSLEFGKIDFHTKKSMRGKSAYRIPFSKLTYLSHLTSILRIANKHFSFAKNIDIGFG